MGVLDRYRDPQAVGERLALLLARHLYASNVIGASTAAFFTSGILVYGSLCLALLKSLYFP